MRERTFTRGLYAVTGAATSLFLIYAFAHPVSPTSVKTTARASSARRTPVPTASSISPVSGSLLDPTKKYLGVAQDNVPNSMTDLASLSKEIGKKPNMIAYYVPWGQPLNQTWVLDLVNDGILPLIQFEPAKPSIAAIASGASDAYATTLAETIKNLDVPIVFSFGHEMNGNWFNWGTQDTSAADFVKAWKRIHDIFTKVGATSVIWLWDVNVTYPVPNVALQPLFPGDAYVDWIGPTGHYNIGAGGRSTFDSLFEPTMEQVRELSQKPFLIAETGVSPSPEKPTEIRDLFGGVEDHTDAAAVAFLRRYREAPAGAQCQ